MNSGNNIWWIVIIAVILCACNGNNGLGNLFGGGCGGNDCTWLIILIVLFCCCGNGFSLCDCDNKC